MQESMPFHLLSTSKIARAVGCHPNTVLLYEKWGLIARVPRAANGYRLYKEEHLDQMRLARTALDGLYPGRVIRRKAYRVIALAVSGELERATEQAGAYLDSIKKEQRRAAKALQVIDRWVNGMAGKINRNTWFIGETANALDLTVDQLRNWERNGLIAVPRNPENRYRRYSQREIDRLRVIELLLHSGFGMMSIHRLMQRVDKGDFNQLRQVLDTPDQHEIIYPSDQWMTALAEQEKRAKRVIVILEEMIAKR
jgi:DNA-binding transcriptional MerR regulator